MKPEYDRRAFIEHAAWFKGAPVDVLDRLAQASAIRHYATNSHVWTMGSETNEIYGVLSGRVRVYQATAAGQEYALVDWEGGAWLGEQTLAVDAPNALGVKVLAPSDLLLIPRMALVEVGQSWPRLYENLFREGWANTQSLYVILSSLAFYPLRARVAGRVLSLLEEHGERVEDGVLLNIKISQNDFARLSMGSRQRVNSIFRSWTRQGLLEIREDRLLIKDVPGLTAEMAPFD